MWVKICIENTSFQLSDRYSMQCATYYNRGLLSTAEIIAIAYVQAG